MALATTMLPVLPMLRPLPPLITPYKFRVPLLPLIEAKVNALFKVTGPFHLGLLPVSDTKASVPLEPARTVSGLLLS